MPLLLLPPKPQLLLLLLLVKLQSSAAKQARAAAVVAAGYCRECGYLPSPGAGAMISAIKLSISGYSSLVLAGASRSMTLIAEMR